MGDKTLGERLLPGLSAVLIALLLAAAGAHYFVGHSWASPCNATRPL